MKDREYILNLYEIYKDLFTDRERDYFENYYYEDYSFQEIADNYEVSKSYASKFVNSIQDKLIKYESALNIYEKNTKLREIIELIDSEEIKNKIEDLL